MEKLRNTRPVSTLLRENIPVLPEQFQLTNLAKQFLFFDRGVGEEQITIFTTQQGIQLFG